MTRPPSRVPIALFMAVATLLTAGTVQAQEAGAWTVWLGAGGTLYGIQTRFDEGRILRGGAGYLFTPTLMVEGGLRHHSCLDCDRFLIVDAGVQARLRNDRFSPFLGAGAGLASDPGFMERKWGAHVSVGSWVRLVGPWEFQLEARGRQVGFASTDYMGEFSVGVARGFARGGR